MPIPRWPRERFTPGGPAARVLFLLFAPEPMPAELPLSREEHGVPEGGVPDALALRTVARDAQPEWFEGFFAEPMRGRAHAALGDAGTRALLDSRFAHVVSVEQREPSDLGYLQASWAVARCLAGLGAVAMLDTHPIRWHAGDAVAADDPGAPLDLGRELSFVFEDRPEGDLGHLAHTRGLAKFGRPDLVLTGLAPGEAPLAGVLLRTLAAEAADGVLFEAGAQASFEGKTITFEDYEPGRHGLPELNLNNPGLVVR